MTITNLQVREPGGMVLSLFNLHGPLRKEPPSLLRSLPGQLDAIHND